LPIVYGTPEHWAARAKEARQMAALIDNPEAKRSMIALAENYEKVAKRAEAREAGIAMPKHSLTGREDI
jgi:hypothetical protein